MKKIIIEGAEKSYGQNKVLKGINFDICENEIFGILGPNGAGKTTLIESILGLRKLDRGSIDVFGTNAYTEHDKFVRLVGAQLQHAEMAPNIKVKEAVRLQAGLFGCKVDVMDKLREYSLDDKENEYFSKLSGGQKQRLFILLSTIHNPKILFFDELSTGLDPVSRREAWSNVLKLKEEGKTIILSTHYMDEAEHICDRVALINNGNLVRVGTTLELVKQLPFNMIVEFEANCDLEIVRSAVKSVEGITSVDSPSARQYFVYGNEMLAADKVKTALEKMDISVYRLKIRDKTLEDFFYYSVKLKRGE